MENRHALIIITLCPIIVLSILLDGEYELTTAEIESADHNGCKTVGN